MFTLASFTSHLFYLRSRQRNAAFGTQALISRLNSLRSLRAFKPAALPLLSPHIFSRGPISQGANTEPTPRQQPGNRKSSSLKS